MMYPKPSHKRLKKTAKQRGAISTKVRNQLKKRSDGICERCRSRVAVHAAHITRRWKLAETTVDDLLHLCLECHIWADGTEAGRRYLKDKENHVE